MAITLIDHIATELSVGGGSTGNINSTGGDFLVYVESDYNASGAGTLTDNKSNTVTNRTIYTSPVYTRIRLSYATNSPSVGSGHHVTSDGVYSAAGIAAFSGLHATAPYGTENGASTSGASLQTGAVTLSEDNMLCIAALSLEDPSQGTVGIDSGFTILDQVAMHSGFAFGVVWAYKIFVGGSGTSPNPTFSWTGSFGAAAAIASFKPAAGGGGPTAFPDHYYRLLRANS